MWRLILKSKIQGARVTDKALNYQGSIEIDEDLVKRADLLPGELVQVINVTNGQRFTTYVIKGQKGSGRVVLNGGAARWGEVGDELIILAYGLLETVDASSFEPRVIKVGSDNRIQ
jgi:aspartate 1-decarboxylase